MDSRIQQLALIVLGFVGSFFVLSELGFYRALGLTPREAVDWLIGPIIRYPEIGVALGILVAVAYLAGRIWEGG